MRSEKVGAATMLSQIVQMVANAQRSKAPMQRMADVVAGKFVVVVLVAVATFIIWGIYGPEPSWVFGLINAVSVLIIASHVLWGWRHRCQSWWQQDALPNRVFCFEMLVQSKKCVRLTH
jgi:protein-S-isoprenylcysteine O-methyltransferase Ste14